MTYERDIEERISLWLEEEGVAHYPDRVLDATFEQTRKLRQAGSSRWRTFPTLRQFGSLAAVGAAAVVLAVVGVFVLRALPDQPGVGGPAAISDPRTPFLGTWISTSDADGGTQTMTVKRGDNNTVEIVVTDTIASVCGLTPSTMTATGTVESNELVMPTVDYRCDDGSEPQSMSGPPLEEQLRNLTYTHDAAADTLTVGSGSVWRRPGAATPSPLPSGLMWPQSTLDEVRAAQERADAGDPDYTWQVEAQLFTDADVWFTNQRGQSEIVGRFLREVLGWEAYELNPFEGMGNNGVYDAFYDQRYLRCAPGDTNPLYPPGPEPEWGELCAPTLDDLRYESVSLDLAQLVRQASDGIFVVNRWRLTEPFAQADPVAVEAQATERLEEFLAARIAGSGAEGYVEVQPNTDVPLLYAATSGAPYERYEIERVDGPRWPDASMTFLVRLFADNATVVQHEISSYQGGLWLDANSTTENGQPVAVSYTSADGEVTVSAPSPWNMWWPEADHVADVGVWFGLMERVSHESGTSIGFVDPVAYDAWCANNGGSPLLSASADAAAIAQQVIADPNFETTAPVPARIGGLDAVSIDVALAPDGEACRVGMIVISRWIHTIAWDPGLRLRLYLVDLPEGMSVETLAITVVAPEERFEEVLEEATPIIESIEFHAP